MSKNKDDNKSNLKNYLRFSNIAIQMGAVITAGALGGRWLDEKQNNSFPVWSLSLILLAIFGSLFQIIRMVIKMSDDEKDEIKNDEQLKKD